MLLFALILILLAAAAQYVLTRNTLRYVQEDCRPETGVAEPGQPFYLRVTLKNTSRRYLPFLRFILTLPEEIEPLDRKHCTPETFSGGCRFSCSAWLRPFGQTDFRIPVRIQKRGRYVLRPLTLFAGDFLGLKEQTRESSCFREVVVAPKEAPAPDIAAAMSGFLGDCSVRRFLYEDPILTAGFREYTGQEPMKKISWTQSARGRGLLVKNDDYTVEPTVSVILNVDMHAAKDAAELEACCCLTRTVCRILEERRTPYDLVTNTMTAGGWYDGGAGTVLRGFGSVHFGRVLELLGRTTDTARESERSMLTSIIDEREAVGRILVTSRHGMPDDVCLHRLREISNGNLLVLTPTPLRTGAKE